MIHYESSPFGLVAHRFDQYVASKAMSKNFGANILS
jgi:hypothetical protein